MRILIYSPNAGIGDGIILTGRINAIRKKYGNSIIIDILSNKKYAIGFQDLNITNSIFHMRELKGKPIQIKMMQSGLLKKLAKNKYDLLYNVQHKRSNFHKYVLETIAPKEVREGRPEETLPYSFYCDNRLRGIARERVIKNTGYINNFVVINGKTSRGNLNKENISFIEKEVIKLGYNPVIIGRDFIGTLHEVGGLISIAELLISVDTSLVHIASALNKKVLGIYADTPYLIQYVAPDGVEFKIVKNLYPAKNENSADFNDLDEFQFIDALKYLLRNEISA